MVPGLRLSEKFLEKKRKKDLWDLGDMDFSALNMGKKRTADASN